MKLEASFDRIIVDLTTKEAAGTSINQFVDDPNTVVYYGHRVSVTFEEIGLRVEMDPYKGSWKDAAWAREQAWKAMLEKLTVEALSQILTTVRKRGEIVGAKLQRAKIRDALGIAPEWMHSIRR